MGVMVKAGGLIQSWDTTGWLHLQELREKEVSAVNLWLPGPEWPVESQEGLTEAGGWDNAVSSEREFQEGKIYVIHWRWDQWEKWDWSRQDWEWDGGLDLEELRKRQRSAANLPTSLAGVREKKKNLYVLLRYLSCSKAKCLGEISLCPAADGSPRFQG